MATPEAHSRASERLLCGQQRVHIKSQNPLEPAGMGERKGQKTLPSDRAGLLWKARGGMAGVWYTPATRQLRKAHKVSMAGNSNRMAQLQTQQPALH